MHLWGHCCREGKTFDQTFFFTSFAMLHSSIRHEFIQVHSCRYFVFSCIVSVQQMQVLRVENGSVDSVDSDITEDRDNIEDVTNIRTDVKTLFLRAAPYLQSWYLLKHVCRFLPSPTLVLTDVLSYKPTILWLFLPFLCSGLELMGSHTELAEQQRLKMSNVFLFLTTLTSHKSFAIDSFTWIHIRFWFSYRCSLIMHWILVNMHECPRKVGVNNKHIFIS